MTNVVISGTGLFTPAHSISNAELVIAFNEYVNRFNESHADDIAAGTITALQTSTVEFIEKASGIKSRYVIDKDGILDPERMTPNIPERPDNEPGIQCEMAVVSARGALAQAGKTNADVDAVIVACSNLQRAYPAVSVEVQQALGIEGYAFDMNVACSSATFGIQAGVSAIQSGAAQSVLVISPEICSSHLNFRDRDSHFIFGDACTAVLLEAGEQVADDRGFDVLDCKLKTQFSNNIRNNFGFLNRCDEQGIGAPDKLFMQKGRRVFKEVIPLVSAMIIDHVKANRLAIEDIRRMWLHQANLNMNLLIIKKVLGRDATADEAPTILDTYANTSSAGSIIAFHQYNSDLRAGDLGIICSFGAGYSAGNVIVRKR